MYRTETIKSLLDATLLVSKVIMQEMQLQIFVERYNNFYYYEALDGHEADEIQQKVLDEFKTAIQLHEKVQTKVIDQLYLANNSREQFIKAGRIDDLEAMRRLSQIAKEFNIEDVIKNLRE